jgi:hypothetical protein
MRGLEENLIALLDEPAIVGSFGQLQSTGNKHRTALEIRMQATIFRKTAPSTRTLGDFGIQRIRKVRIGDDLEEAWSSAASRNWAKRMRPNCLIVVMSVPHSDPSDSSSETRVRTLASTRRSFPSYNTSRIGDTKTERSSLCDEGVHPFLDTGHALIQIPRIGLLGGGHAEPLSALGTLTESSDLYCLNFRSQCEWSVSWREISKRRRAILSKAIRPRDSES